MDAMWAFILCQHLSLCNLTFLKNYLSHCCLLIHLCYLYTHLCALLCTKFAVAVLHNFGSMINQIDLNLFQQLWVTYEIIEAEAHTGSTLKWVLMVLIAPGQLQTVCLKWICRNTDYVSHLLNVMPKIMFHMSLHRFSLVHAGKDFRNPRLQISI